MKRGVLLSVRPARLVSLGLAVCLWVSTLMSPAARGQEAKVKLKAESTSEALTMYGDAANFQNNGAFELAAAEWDKFLKQFPDDPLVPKAQHYAGVCHLQLKNLDKAAANFQATVSKYDKFELTEDAWLNLGWCQFTLAAQEKPDLYAQAIAAFSTLLKDYPEGKFRDQALFFRGESLIAQDKRQEALADYRKLVDEFPKSSLRCDGLYALGVTQEELSQFAEAGQTYDLFLKECADSELATEVRMRKAETILQAGDLAAAEKMFGEVAAVPDFASADHALFRRAYCLARLDQFAEAGKLYASLATDYPQSTYRGEAAMFAGRNYYRAENLAEAAKWFDKVIADGTADAGEAAHWSCRMLLKQQQPDKAVALADKVLPAAKESSYLVHLLMDRADALYEIPDRRGEALAQYVKIAAEHPQHEQAPQALYNAAFTALDQKQFDKALEHAAAFRQAYAQHRLRADVEYVTAESQLQSGAADKAEAAFRELVKNHAQHPDNPLWLTRLGLALYLQKKYEDVVAALGTQAAGLPSADLKAEAWFLTGASQFYLDQFDAAAKSLQAALEASAKWRQADETLLFLSRAQRKLNQLDAARATAGRLLVEFPQSPLLDQAHFRLGEYSYAADDFPSAVTEYGLVVEKWPQSVFVPYATYGLGWSRMKLKEYDKAAAAFSQLLSATPQHTLVPDAHFARAMCRRQTGQFQEAIEDVQAYLKTDPELPARSDALYERGLAEVALKQFEAAAATFAELLKANDKYAAADKVRYELAWAYKSLQNDEGAGEQFQRLASEHPESPLAAEANFHVGERLYEQKKYAEAAQAYTRAAVPAASAGLSEKALYKLGWSYFQDKQYAQALAQFDKQLQAHADGPLRADGLFMKGESLFRLEKYAEALPVFEQASQQQHSSPLISTLVLLHGGQAAGQLKQWDKSLALLAPIPEKFADSPYLAQALYETAWARQNLKQVPEAIALYEQAATKSRGEVGARARFMIGELQFAAQKYNEAILEFQRVMLGYGGEQAPPEVKRWQAQAGFEAARCAEVRIKDATDAKLKAELLEEAKKYFNYVVEKHPQSDLVEQARMRLAALAKL